MHTTLTEPLRERAALYALDALAPGERHEFEQHLAGGCAVCASEVDSLSAVAGNLALAAEPVAPSPAVRARVLAEATRPQQATADAFPLVLQDEGTWTEIAAGAHRKMLLGTETRGALSYLIRMQPRARVGRHVHDSIEHCYVVSGDAYINGRHLFAGDFTAALVGSTHDESTTDGGCVLLLVESRPGFSA